MSAERRRGTRTPRTAESWSPADGRVANTVKNETLKRRLLERKARAHGLALRHSSYGYSLVDAARSPVDGRNDMTLDEVERHLNRL